MDGRRRVNLKLREDLHRRLKTRAAERGVTLQEFIESMCEREVGDLVKPRKERRS